MTPDLDRWLAEELMGWEQMTFPKFLAQYNKEPYTTHYCDELVWVASDYQLALPGSIAWHPTKDLNQAFMCVEKMREMKWSGKIDWDDKGEFCTEFWRYNPNINGKECWDADPATAICKAIHAALEGE